MGMKWNKKLQYHRTYANYVFVDEITSREVIGVNIKKASEVAGNFLCQTEEVKNSWEI